MTYKIRKYVIIAFRFSVVIYTLIALYYFLGKQAGGGDEALFIRDLHLIETAGWSLAIQRGISIPYMLLAYPVTFIFEPFIALRLVNLLLFTGLLLYFYKAKGIRALNFYALLFFFYSTVGYFLAGTNDTLFVVCLVIFMVETRMVLATNEKSSLFWLGTSLVIAFFTRELIIVYSPVIVLALFFILKKNKGKLRTLIVPALLIVLFVILNVPSLNYNKTVSYDKKLPPKTTTATWVQRQYYAQLLVNEGKLANYNHPGWKQTQQYLDKNGIASLPRTISEAMMFNPKMTIKEFFKDFMFIFIYGTRQLGLILVVVLFLLFKRLYIDKKLTTAIFIPTALLLMMSIFAFIIISFVELRWLAPVFVTAIVHFYLLIVKRKIPRIIVQANYICIALLSWYGIYGMITKL